jgi:hypothetical protein
MRAGVVCGSEFVGLNTVVVCSHSICSTEVMVAMADGEDYFFLRPCLSTFFIKKKAGMPTGC